MTTTFGDHEPDDSFDGSGDVDFVQVGAMYHNRIGWFRVLAGREHTRAEQLDDARWHRLALVGSIVYFGLWLDYHVELVASLVHRAYVSEFEWPGVVDWAELDPTSRALVVELIEQIRARLEREGIL